MKSNTWVWIAGIGLLFWLVTSGNTAAAASTLVLADGTTYNFNALLGQSINGVTITADLLGRLTKLYLAMQGKGLTALQIQLMLSQALFETGLFTQAPNFHNMDVLNNYAGITGNSRYPAGAGSGYAQYPSLDAFVDDWIGLISSSNDPIDATSVTDFVTRLRENGYYTDSIQNYGNGVATYFNLLNSINSNNQA